MVKGYPMFICCFIHSFIPDSYIAPLEGKLLRSAPNPIMAEKHRLSCRRNVWEWVLGSDWEPRGGSRAEGGVQSF